MKKLLLATTIFFIFTSLQAFGQAETVDKLYQEYLSTADTSRLKSIYYARYIDALRFIDAEKAIIESEKLLEVSIKKQDNTGIGYAYFELGMIYKNKSYNLLAEKTLLEGIEYFKKTDKISGLANSYNGLGILNAQKGNFENAIEYFKTSKEYFEKIKDTAAVSQALMNLSKLSLIFGNLVMAEEYAQKSLEWLKSDLAFEGQLYLTFSKIELKKNNAKKAREYLNKSLQLNQSADRLYFLPDSYNALVEFLIFENKIDSALFYLDKSLELTKKFDNPESEINILQSKGDILINRKDYKNALESFTKAFEIVKKGNNKVAEISLLDDLADVYEIMGDYKKSHQYIKQKIALKDSLINENILVQSEELRLQMKFKDKEKEIELLNQKDNLKKLEIERQKTLSITLGFLLVISLGLLVYVVIQHNKKIKLFNQLQRKKNELEKSNLTKDRLFSIIGHDLKKPFANISSTIELLKNNDLAEDELEYLLTALDNTNKSTTELLDTLLYWGMAERKHLNNGTGVIDLKNNVSKVLEFLKPIAIEKNIQLNFDLEKNHLVLCEENQFNFIIRNLISNAIKFTPKNGKIDIKVSKTETKIKISIQDSGVGLDINRIEKILHGNERFSNKGTENESGTGLGLIITKEFISENKGELFIESKIGEGSIFSLTLPLA